MNIYVIEDWLCTPWTGCVHRGLAMYTVDWLYTRWTGCVHGRLAVYTVDWLCTLWTGCAHGGLVVYTVDWLCTRWTGCVRTVDWLTVRSGLAVYAQWTGCVRTVDWLCTHSGLTVRGGLAMHTGVEIVDWWRRCVRVCVCVCVWHRCLGGIDTLCGINSWVA